MAIEGFKDIYIQACLNCNRFFYRNKWVIFPDLATAIKSCARERINLSKTDTIELTPLIDKISKVKGKQSFEIRTVINNEEYTLPAKISFVTCPLCSRAKTKYYEAILQIRDSNDEIIGFARNELSKLSSKGVFITDTKKLDSGVDLYLTSKSAARTVGSKLRDKFGGQLTVTAKLFSVSKETSKELYRLVILFNAPLIKKGDIINYKGESIKIVYVGKKIQAIDPRGKRITLNHKELKHYMKR